MINNREIAREGGGRDEQFGIESGEVWCEGMEMEMEDKS